MLTCIRHATIIDGTGAAPLPDCTVVIENGLIREVGPSGSVGVRSEGATVIDGRGKTLLPGLMDMHVHLHIPSNPYEIGGGELRLSERTVARAAMHALDNARQLIARGVTTVRDVGSHGHGIFEVKRLIDEGQLAGPRIVACGRSIAMTGGHGLYHSAEADGPDDVRRVARIELKAGAGALKFMASGAGAEARESPYDVQLTQEELTAGIQEAKARRRTTCAHAVNPDAVRNAVLAGIDSIEHGVLIDEPSLLLMREQGVHFVPTVWTYQMTAEHGEVHGTESWVVTEVKQRVKTHLEMVSRAHELGVEVATGTDSAIPVNPADSIFWEIEWLTHCGFSALEAIRAATLNGARLLEREAQLGSIEAGKVADLLMVEGDPLEDIRALRRTVLVMKDGAIMVHDGQAQFGPLLKDPRNPPEGPLPPVRVGRR